MKFHQQLKKWTEKKIESQIISVKEEIVPKGDLINNLETGMKRLKIENREKCKEIRQLKTEVNSLNKDARKYKLDKILSHKYK